jgi:hypothetical protein
MSFEVTPGLHQAILVEINFGIVGQSTYSSIAPLEAAVGKSKQI